MIKTGQVKYCRRTRERAWTVGAQNKTLEILWTSRESELLIKVMGSIAAHSYKSKSSVLFRTEINVLKHFALQQQQQHQKKKKVSGPIIFHDSRWTSHRVYKDRREEGGVLSDGEGKEKKNDTSLSSGDWIKNIPRAARRMNRKLETFAAESSLKTKRAKFSHQTSCNFWSAHPQHSGVRLVNLWGTLGFISEY